ncbi:hypothetical protein Tdes44962_MAKER05520 [Teratosphaeria destructans]|uniref:Uncharacterized protein n=1 Tax=Teratosphaeria destructans TaxID=418781 RepID=A0A9W7SJR9_9PEZI|nr:hypothetical protein Tdes44962_MAKER05520 [Teratosphaeria destructans]
MATPPPSTQVPPRPKTRTPTPSFSHISTPPPTIDTVAQAIRHRVYALMSHEEIASATPDELRARVADLQAAWGEAKLAAAHHKLQYTMLAQESQAAIERMAVEARMAQYENDVIHNAEQARAAAMPVQPPPLQEGIIPVQKDLYTRICRDIQRLTQENHTLRSEHRQQERLIERQETEIASLTDRVTLMRERIRESRDASYKIRGRVPHLDATPRSAYSTPHRGHGRQEQSQPFAALLQASEMMAGQKGHRRSAQSMSSLPNTPARSYLQQPYHTPSTRQAPVKVPSTAPMPRVSAMRTPGQRSVYAQPSLPFTHTRGPASEGTVSNSDGEQNAQDDDSEAETDIIEAERDDDKISESQASRAALQMLRASQEQEAKRNRLKGNGMLARELCTSSPAGTMRQTKLFGQVRKPIVRAGEDPPEPPAKRQRTDDVSSQPRGIGLGIAGVRS